MKGYQSKEEAEAKDKEEEEKRMEKAAKKKKRRIERNARKQKQPSRKRKIEIDGSPANVKRRRERADLLIVAKVAPKAAKAPKVVAKGRKVIKAAEQALQAGLVLVTRARSPQPGASRSISKN